MKKVLGSLLAGLMICAAPMALPSAAEAAHPLAITATAGPVAGTGYIGMAALGKVYATQNAADGASVTMVPGSDVSNPLRLEKGEVDAAVQTMALAVCAREGQSPFKKVVSNLNSIANIRNNSRLNIVVRSDSGITSLDQLKEKKMSIRLATGPRGSASEVMGKWVLEAYGITYKDITSWGGKLFSNNFGDVANMAKDGQVDMMFWVGPGEAWFFTELISGTALTWIPVKPEVAKIVKEKYNLNDCVFESTMFGGKMGKNVPGVATSQQVMVRSGVSDDVAYRLTKAFCEGAQDVIAANPVWSTFKPETAWQGLTHDLHPGAVKYYKEKGWMK